MNSSSHRQSKPISIAVFTAAPWESAVVVLRVTGPAERAGMRVIKGNQGPRVSLDGIAEADMVVIQRDFPRFWEDYRRVIQLAREGGKPVIYDLDDLLVEIPDGHSHRADYAGEMLTMLYAILDADMVTASSTNLQAYLSELNPNTRLVENYLNDSLWEMKEPGLKPDKDISVSIGYMGGQTHQADLEYIKYALLNVFEKFPEKVKFKLRKGAKFADLYKESLEKVFEEKRAIREVENESLQMHRKMRSFRKWKIRGEKILRAR